MSRVYADCIAQQAKLGIVRGCKPNVAEEEEEGVGKASNAAAMANAEFKHKREEMWLVNGKGCRYSVELEVDDPGEAEVERAGTCVGSEELQPQDPVGEELRES